MNTDQINHYSKAKRNDYPFTPEQESAAVFIAAMIILCLVIIPLGMML